MSMLLQATEAVAETTEQTQTMGLGELFLAGGWLMWPLLLLGRRLVDVALAFIGRCHDFHLL